MMITRRLPSGEVIPDPNRYPTDLVYVRDVYGRRHRVRAAHLADDDCVKLRRFNQYGNQVEGDVCPCFVHRDNLVKT